jgi:hypothetical protein
LKFRRSQVGAGCNPMGSSSTDGNYLIKRVHRHEPLGGDILLVLSGPAGCERNVGFGSESRREVDTRRGRRAAKAPNFLQCKLCYICRFAMQVRGGGYFEIHDLGLNPRAKELLSATKASLSTWVPGPVHWHSSTP